MDESDYEHEIVKLREVSRTFMKTDADVVRLMLQPPVLLSRAKHYKLSALIKAGHDAYNVLFQTSSIVHLPCVDKIVCLNIASLRKYAPACVHKCTLVHLCLCMCPCLCFCPCMHICMRVRRVFAV